MKGYLCVAVLLLGFHQVENAMLGYCLSCLDSVSLLKLSCEILSVTVTDCFSVQRKINLITILVRHMFYISGVSALDSTNIYIEMLGLKVSIEHSFLLQFYDQYSSVPGQPQKQEGVIPMKRSANFMDNFTGKPLGFHT